MMDLSGSHEGKTYSQTEWFMLLQTSLQLFFIGTILAKRKDKKEGINSALNIPHDTPPA